MPATAGDLARTSRSHRPSPSGYADRAAADAGRAEGAEVQRVAEDHRGERHGAGGEPAPAPSSPGTAQPLGEAEHGAGRDAGARIQAKVPAHSTSDPLSATCAMKPRRPAAQARPHSEPSPM